jgi:hypothetical protein
VFSCERERAFQRTRTSPAAIRVHKPKPSDETAAGLVRASDHADVDPSIASFTRRREKTGGSMKPHHDQGRDCDEASNQQAANRMCGKMKAEHLRVARLRFAIRQRAAHNDEVAWLSSTPLRTWPWPPRNTRKQPLPGRVHRGS